MAAVLLLVRHATNDFVGKALAGRTPGVSLNAQGVAQAARLAERLACARPVAICTSPLERARETAAPLAARLSMEPQVCSELNEVDCGAWAGKRFAELEADPQWAIWVQRRTKAKPPGGETILEVERRVTALVMRLIAQHDGHTLVLVSHADVIKCALARALGMSLDDLERFEIAPASVSAIVGGAGWTQVKRVNDTGTLEAF